MHHCRTHWACVSHYFQSYLLSANIVFKQVTGGIFKWIVYSLMSLIPELIRLKQQTWHVCVSLDDVHWVSLHLNNLMKNIYCLFYVLHHFNLFCISRLFMDPSSEHSQHSDKIFVCCISLTSATLTAGEVWGVRTGLTLLPQFATSWAMLAYVPVVPTKALTWYSPRVTYWASVGPSGAFAWPCSCS